MNDPKSMFVNPHTTIQLLAEQQRDYADRVDRVRLAPRPVRPARIRRRLRRRGGISTPKSMLSPTG
jgi:hypothetical protein